MRRHQERLAFASWRQYIGGQSRCSPSRNPCPTLPASCRKSNPAIRQAAEKLLPLVYDELRKLAAAKLAQEKPGQTLQATALVHDAYLRLVDVENAQQLGDARTFFRGGGGGDASHPGRKCPPQAVD